MAERPKVERRLDEVTARLKDTSAFEEELGNLINRHSMESGSDTPEFILAEYLRHCLEAFNAATNARNKFYNAD